MPSCHEDQLLTPQQTRILLTDIACCSLMNLETTSMDKLWDLMIMVMKWQLFITQNPHQLLEMTFRHLDGIGKLIPEMRKNLLIDCSQSLILDFWNTLSNADKHDLWNKLIKWLDPFNVKISVLLRLGVQKNDGTFEDIRAYDQFQTFIDNFGENIYAEGNYAAGKKPSIKRQKKKSTMTSSNHQHSNVLENFVDQLNIKCEQSPTLSENLHVILDDVKFAINDSNKSPSQESNEKEQFVVNNKGAHVIQITSEFYNISERINLLNIEDNLPDFNTEISPRDQLLTMLDEC